MEILVVQVNVLLFDPYRDRSSTNSASYALIGVRRSLFLGVENLIEMILWFAIFFRQAAFAQVATVSRFDFVALSFYSMTTFGPLPTDVASHVPNPLLLFEGAVGLFMLSGVLVRVFALLPDLDTQDRAERGRSDVL